MEFSRLIKPIEQLIKSDVENKPKILMENFEYLVNELRSSSTIFKPLRDYEYNAITRLVEDKDPSIRFIGLNIVNLISPMIQEESCEKFIIKCFDQILKVIKNMNLEDPLFLPSVMTWRKLFIKLKEIQDTKSSSNIGSVDKRANANNSLSIFKLISNTLFRNIDKLFESCFGNSEIQVSGVLSKTDKIKSLELVLYTLSDAIDNFPSSLKSLVSRKQNESKDRLLEILISVIQGNHCHIELCIGMIKILSKMFLLKDKKTDGWCFQISKVVESISGFLSVCIPIDINKEQDLKIEEIYDKRVIYKFIKSNEKVTLSNSISMMNYLFTLLKFTLNQSKSDPHLIFGSMKIKEILHLLERIISQEKLDPKGSITAYLGLTAFEFNLFITHCKINACEVLRQIVLSFNMIDHLSLIKNCVTSLLKSEETMSSHNLMCESLALLQACIKQYKFSFAKIAVGLIVKGQYIITPDLMNHILALFKVILLRKDITQIEIEEGKLKAGLRVLDSVGAKDLSIMYNKYSNKSLESKLTQYLSFLKCCVEQSVLNVCTKRELAIVDNNLYTILHLCNVKFSPIRKEVKILILDIATNWLLNSEFSVHSHFILGGLLHFIDMVQSGEVDSNLPFLP